jgi:hypothetical protein
MREQRASMRMREASGIERHAELLRSYADAARRWRRAEDLSAWAAECFRFDAERALQFSSTQRRVGPPPTIAEPEAFFAEPAGICLDLARFAVETLRRIDPAAQARYLMIEFEPMVVDGHVLRLHWMASFRRDGQLFFFADSDRPGHIAGPYAASQDFIADYQAFRGRPVVRHLELDSLQRPSPGTAAR